MTHMQTKLNKNQINKLARRFLLSSKFYKQIDLSTIMILYPESYMEFIECIGEKEYKDSVGQA